jgi:hypothetical protein
MCWSIGGQPVLLPGLSLVNLAYNWSINTNFSLSQFLAKYQRDFNHILDNYNQYYEITHEHKITEISKILLRYD